MQKPKVTKGLCKANWGEKSSELLIDNFATSSILMLCEVYRIDSLVLVIGVAITIYMAFDKT